MIQWTADFATNISKVDEQHQTIIIQLNKLHDQMKQAKGKEEISHTIAFLEQYTKDHFAQEEQLMDQYHCPMAAENKAQHAIFMKKIASFREQFDRDSANIMLILSVQRELTDWILNHILKVDLKLKQCVPS